MKASRQIVTSKIIGLVKSPPRRIFGNRSRSAVSVNKVLSKKSVTMELTWESTAHQKTLVFESLFSVGHFAKMSVALKREHHNFIITLVTVQAFPVLILTKNNLNSLSTRKQLS